MDSFSYFNHQRRFFFDSSSVVYLPPYRIDVGGDNLPINSLTKRRRGTEDIHFSIGFCERNSRPLVAPPLPVLSIRRGVSRVTWRTGLALLLAGPQKSLESRRIRDNDTLPPPPPPLGVFSGDNLSAVDISYAEEQRVEQP